MGREVWESSCGSSYWKYVWEQHILKGTIAVCYLEAPQVPIFITNLAKHEFGEVPGSLELPV